MAEEIVKAPPAAAAVVQWLIQGQAEQHISEALQERYPETDPGAVMGQVEAHLKAAGQANAEAVKGWEFLSLKDLYRRALDVGDYDCARKILNDIARLML